MDGNKDNRSKKELMDMTTKLAVCDMRLDGASVYEVAEEFKVTPQSIHNFVSLFPCEEKLIIKPECGKDVMINACRDFIMGCTIEEIASNYGLTDSDVKAIFSCISKRKSVRVKKSLYPALTDWMRDNGWSVKGLSEIIGVTPSKLSAIIAGKQKNVMPYDMAKKIQDITNLSFAEIYQKWR